MTGAGLLQTRKLEKKRETKTGQKEKEVCSKMRKNHEYRDSLLNQSLSRMQQDLSLWYVYCLRPVQVVLTASRMKAESVLLPSVIIELLCDKTRLCAEDPVTGGSL